MPLITLIVVYAISVLGLALMPGTDPAGQSVAPGLLPRVLRDELHRDDDRVRRTALSLQRRAARLADPVDLPVGDRLDLRPRLDLRADHRSDLPQHRGAGASSAGGRRDSPTRSSSSAAAARAARRWPVRSTGWATGSCSWTSARTARRGSRSREFTMPPVVLVADARNPEVLTDAGIHKPECKGVIALTSLDSANQTISIGAKVLSNDMLVIARVKDSVELEQPERVRRRPHHQSVPGARDQHRRWTSPRRKCSGWRTGSPTRPARPAPAGSTCRRVPGCWSATAASASRSPRCWTRRTSTGAPSTRARRSRARPGCWRRTTPSPRCGPPAS